MLQVHNMCFVPGCWVEKCLQIPEQLVYDCAVSFYVQTFLFSMVLSEWIRANFQRKIERIENNSKALMDWKREEFESKNTKNIACTTTKTQKKKRQKGPFWNGWTATEKCCGRFPFSIPEMGVFRMSFHISSFSSHITHRKLFLFSSFLAMREGKKIKAKL